MNESLQVNYFILKNKTKQNKTLPTHFEAFLEVSLNWFTIYFISRRMDIFTAWMTFFGQIKSCQSLPLGYESFKAL